MIDYISLEKYAKEISILFVEDDKGISKKMEILLYEIFSKGGRGRKLVFPRVLDVCGLISIFIIILSDYVFYVYSSFK